MNIIGPDSLVFGVDDVEACEKCLTDYGLNLSGDGAFEALDGTSIVIRPRDDASLPVALQSDSMLRQTIYGVADEATLEAIAAELGKDREVTRLEDGSLACVDDLGFALGFQVTVRRPVSLPGEMVNSPGAPVQRPANVIGCDPSMDSKPRTLSHVVYFVPDAKKAEAFYAERLGFVTTDRFTSLGPFMRPAGTHEHHTLFMIQTPPFMQGCEHFTFHVAGPTELMLAGTRFLEKGHESFWGPGRHLMGSNWFWYFNCPMGCHIEYDADMDLHDDDWIARAVPASADTSQLFLFAHREKWAPTGPPE
jgi:catechol 2,3-dioxygenase-like lactoylglutathione lyase family enzyme